MNEPIPRDIAYSFSIITPKDTLKVSPFHDFLIPPDIKRHNIAVDE